MSRAAQLVQAVLAEGTAKDFLRSVMPTDRRWLEPLGFVQQHAFGGRTVFLKSRVGPRHLRSDIEVETTDAVRPEGLVTVQMTLGHAITRETYYTQSFSFFWCPDRIPHKECVEMIVTLLQRLVAVPLMRDEQAIAAVKLAFEDTVLGYYQALADAAHAHGEDEPEDEP
jgi:hypothetical protein